MIICPELWIELHTNYYLCEVLGRLPTLSLDEESCIGNSLLSLGGEVLSACKPIEGVSSHVSRVLQNIQYRLSHTQLAIHLPFGLCSGYL